MTKIISKSSNITPYGGLFFIDDVLAKNSVVKDLITSYLGERSIFAQYSYYDICKSLFYNNLTQGEFLADLETLKNRLPKSLSQFVPSPDTVEYASQELKVENLVIPITESTSHQINENTKFNGYFYIQFDLSEHDGNNRDSKFHHISEPIPIYKLMSTIDSDSDGIEVNMPANYDRAGNSTKGLKFKIKAIRID